MEGVLLTATTRSVSATSEDVRSTVSDRGAYFFLSVTKAPNTAETVTFKIEAKDLISGNYVVITSFSGVAGENLQEGGTLVFMLYPDEVVSESSNVNEEKIPLPRHWRAVVAHSEAGEWAYGLSYQPLQ